jgi:hypothetical protein
MTGGAIRHPRGPGERLQRRDSVTAEPVRALRRSLARCLLRAHLWMLAGLVLPDGSVVFLNSGTMVAFKMVAFKLDGKLIVREGRRIQ